MHVNCEDEECEANYKKVCTRGLIQIVDKKCIDYKKG